MDKAFVQVGPEHRTTLSVWSPGTWHHVPYFWTFPWAASYLVTSCQCMLRSTEVLKLLPLAFTFLTSWNVVSALYSAVALSSAFPSSRHFACLHSLPMTSLQMCFDSQTQQVIVFGGRYRSPMYGRHELLKFLSILLKSVGVLLLQSSRKLYFLTGLSFFHSCLSYFCVWIWASFRSMSHCFCRPLWTCNQSTMFVYIYMVVLPQSQWWVWPWQGECLLRRSVLLWRAVRNVEAAAVGVGCGML